MEFFVKLVVGKKPQINLACTNNKISIILIND